MSTGNAYLDDVIAKAGGFIGRQDAPVVRDFLIHALMVDAGIVIFEPGAQLSGGVVRFVNAALLSLLFYPDLGTYAAAVATPGFVHADDADVAADHILYSSTAVYDARFKRGDSGLYRKCRTQGITFTPPLPTGGTLRVTIVRDAP